MEIARHWRLRRQRLRLEGFKYPDGFVSLDQRPAHEEKPTSSSISLSYTLDNYMVEPEKQPQKLEQ